MSNAAASGTGRNHLVPENRHREYDVAREVQQEYPLPFATDPSMAPVTPAVFSHYYGVETRHQLNQETRGDDEYPDPEIGDIEEIRLYLGLRQDELADAIGVARGTYYQWRMQNSSPSLKSLGAAITALTDAWEDPIARNRLLDRDDSDATEESPARTATLRHLCDLANVPNAARSDAIRISKTEMAFIYGALTGDYRTPLCAEEKTGVYRLVAAECGLNGSKIADRGRFKNVELLDVQAELMTHGAPSPRLDGMAREPTRPRPHRESMTASETDSTEGTMPDTRIQPSQEVREMLSRSRELAGKRRTGASGDADRVPENLERLFDEIGLRDELATRARELYQEAAGEGALTGRSVASLLAAVVVRAGREQSYTIPIQYAADQLGVESSAVMEALRELRTAVGLTSIPASPLDFLPFLTDRVTITPGSEEEAKAYLEKVDDLDVGFSRNPVGMAAAAVYKATRGHYTQLELSLAAGVREETVRVSLSNLNEALD